MRGAGRSFLGVLAFLLVLSPASAVGSGAHSSIVGGELAGIKDWTWQVALTMPKHFIGNKKPSARFRCGGTLLSPKMVLTAAHCVQSYGRFTPARDISVIAGRADLDDLRKGKEVAVKNVELPLAPSGRPRNFDRDNSWDIALLELAEPIHRPTIKLLGPDESHLMEAGRTVLMAGWGSTRKDRAQPVERQLQETTTALQSNRVCRHYFQEPLDPQSQFCVTDPATRSIPCAGDSGGPAVIDTSDGRRLVGVASSGRIDACMPSDPLIDADVTQRRTRTWISKRVRAASGIDPVGAGATAGPVPAYCRLPRIFGREPAAASAAILRADCTAGTIGERTIGGPPRRRALDGKVLWANGIDFALRDPTNPVDMVVARWDPSHGSKR